MATHFEREHPEYPFVRKREKDKAVYYCGRCGDQVGAFPGLVRHAQREHEEEIRADRQMAKAEKPTRKEGDDVMSRCYVCEELVRWPHTMATHFQDDHSEYAFISKLKPGTQYIRHHCEVCDASIASFPHLVQHYRRYHNDVLTEKATLDASSRSVETHDISQGQPLCEEENAKGVASPLSDVREQGEAEHMKTLDNLLDFVGKSMELLYEARRERDAALQQGMDTGEKESMLKEMERLREQIAHSWQKRDELRERCTQYAARIVELQNLLAEDTKRRY